VAAESHTWPREAFESAWELPRQADNHLICFLACAFRPSDRADELLQFIQSVCDELGREMKARVECIRADKLPAPGTIHADIWRYIDLADAVIFDVTALNGNVLVELGVAAARRPQHSVVILRDREDQAEQGRFLFDLSPARHLLYRRSPVGSLEFGAQLKEALLHALTPAPYSRRGPVAVDLPLRLSLAAGRNPPELLSPAAMHRRPTDSGLEFGSLYVFRYSWLTLGDSDYSDVSIAARMRMTQRHPAAGAAEGWIGVSLRSTHFFANYGHLVYVKPDGTLWYTEPHTEISYRDVPWGTVPRLDPDRPIDIAISLGAGGLRMKVDGVSHEVGFEDMPYVRHAGRVRFQTHLCRAILEEVNAHETNDRP
jgi:hypothetical protein